MSFCYMAESASEQDEGNPVFWLATSGLYGLIMCAEYFPHRSHKKKVLLLVGV